MKKRFTHCTGLLSLTLITCIICFSKSWGYAPEGILVVDNSASMAIEREGLMVLSEKAFGFYQADMIVRGKVTGEDGEPLPGVTVILKGTGTGTTTDINGNYRLQIPEGQENGTLVFSFIGLKTQEVDINSRSVIDIQMHEDVQSLEEVVVIGYQTVRKKDLTGAAAVIDTEKAERVTAASVAESIQGLAPGVTVRNGGAPGQGASVEIRGASSFSNTNPLYVIDGMIADANPTINTNDIASIQILKDASAAAIYGSRAANGVIIITTKRGKEGPTKISLSAKYGIQQIPNRWDLMNSEEFANMQRIQYQNSGLTPLPSVGSEFNPSIDTDWQEEVIRTGNAQDYNLSLSGGTESGNYFVSGSYFKNEGVLIGHSFDRVSLRINSQSKKGRVTFGENLVLTNSNDESPGAGNAFYDMAIMLPVIPVQSPDFITESNPEGWGRGNNDAITYAWNPVAVNNIFSRRANFAKVVGNAYVDVEILDWLNYKFNAGVEASYDFIESIRRDGEWHFNQPAAPSFVNNERSRFSSLLFEHTLNFNKNFGAHDINGVVGYTQQHTKREVTSAGRTDLQSFNGEYLTTINSAIGEPTASGFVPVDFRINGYLGRLNYTYDDKYLLTFTGRLDQDSRFGEDYRSAFFPSVAAGWRISEENFFNVDWISGLKLHASYGTLGIVTLGSWDYIGFLNSNPRAIFGPDQSAYVGATQARLANPDLHWEERISKNIGFDAHFFNDKLSVSADFYNSLSQDVLVNLPVAWYLGNLGGDPAVNAASVRNKGVEFEATYRNRESDFKWDISANFTTISNKVEDVGNFGEGIDYIQTGITRTQVGRSIGEWYVLKADGIFQSQAEIDNYRNSDGEIIQPFAQPGDIRFLDINDDGEINQEDRTFVGSPWPTLQTGAQFNASYKKFSLNVQLIGVFGYEVLNGVRQVLDSYQNTNFRSGISPWSPDNTDTSDPRIGVAINDPGLIDNARLESSRWLEDASYVRLRNIEIGYTLPEGFLSRIDMQGARVFLSGQNLFTITEYSGLDPDVVGNGILERGFDNGNWPSSRIISFGIRADF